MVCSVEVATQLSTHASCSLVAKPPLNCRPRCDDRTLQIANRKRRIWTNRTTSTDDGEDGDSGDDRVRG